MNVLTFQSRFAPLVAQGLKTQTVRRDRKRPPKDGEVWSLREWTGTPRRSPQRELARGKIIDVSRVMIFPNCAFVDQKAAFIDELARADGFADWPDMVAWFEQTHGLPFHGILIRWEWIPVPENAKSAGTDASEKTL